MHAADDLAITFLASLKVKGESFWAAGDTDTHTIPSTTAPAAD